MCDHIASSESSSLDVPSLSIAVLIMLTSDAVGLRSIAMLKWRSAVCVAAAAGAASARGRKVRGGDGEGAAVAARCGRVVMIVLVGRQ